MSNHTKAPWQAVETAYGIYVVSVPDGQRSVCEIVSRTGPVDSANAQLISAAPELLAACRNALADVLYDENSEHTLCHTTLDKLREAVAKAEGKEK